MRMRRIAAAVAVTLGLALAGRAVLLGRRDRGRPVASDPTRAPRADGAYDPRALHLCGPGSTTGCMAEVPGGTFVMGAQSGNPDGRNYDPAAADDEGPPHTVTLSPFYAH